MTRLLVLSDLHQNDGGRSFDPASEITAAFDIAIVAGDSLGRTKATGGAGRTVGTSLAGGSDYSRPVNLNRASLPQLLHLIGRGRVR